MKFDPSQQPELQYARLLGPRADVRPIVPADATALFPLVHRQTAVTDMLVWNGPEDLAELELAYASWRRGDRAIGRDYMFAIRPAAGGDPVGGCGIRFSPTPGVGNLGYWLGEAHWGKGYMSDAVALLCWLGFERLGALRMEALCLGHNVGSQRVLEKCGFSRDAGWRPDAELHDRHTAPEGIELCELRYVLERADWSPRPGFPVVAEVLLADAQA
ncbi:MAG: GNAT family N-acetyltransferase [Planctomycetota bacterium]|nr:GNAT family N-acetyltransferase [Planctomycetota bacterium]